MLSGVKRTCRIQGCNEPTWDADGVCRTCKRLIAAGLKEEIFKKEGVAGMADKKICTTEGCESGAQKDGLCNKHYKEKYGSAPYPCKETGCNSFPYKSGFCYAHYKEKHGSMPATGGGKKKASAKKPAKTSGTKTPKPQPASTDMVMQLKENYIEARDNVKTLFVTLKTIEKYTGKDLDIPDLPVVEV